MKVLFLTEENKLEIFDKFITSAVQSKFGDNIVVVGSMGKEYQLYGRNKEKPNDYIEPNDIDLNMYLDSLNRKIKILEKFIDEVIEIFNCTYGYDYKREGELKITSGTEEDVRKIVGNISSSGDKPKIKIDVHLKLQEDETEEHETYQGVLIATLVKANPISVSIKNIIDSKIRKNFGRTGREKYFKTLYDYIQQFDIPITLLIKSLSNFVKSIDSSNYDNFIKNKQSFYTYYSKLNYSWFNDEWFENAFNRISKFLLPLLTENINMKSDKRIWSSAKCEWEIRENELWYNQFQYNKKLRKIRRKSKLYKNNESTHLLDNDHENKDNREPFITVKAKELNKLVKNLVIDKIKKLKEIKGLRELVLECFEVAIDYVINKNPSYKEDMENMKNKMINNVKSYSDKKLVQACSEVKLSEQVLNEFDWIGNIKKGFGIIWKILCFLGRGISNSVRNISDSKDMTKMGLLCLAVAMKNAHEHMKSLTAKENDSDAYKFLTAFDRKKN